MAILITQKKRRLWMCHSNQRSLHRNRRRLSTRRVTARMRMMIMRTAILTIEQFSRKNSCLPRFFFCALRNLWM